MATFEKGILGGFSGKVGPIVGATWKGKDVMRSRPNKKKGGSSVKQLDQQLKFSAVVSFQSPFNDLLDVTFKGYATDITAQNSAFAYNIQNALGGKSPDYVINYEKALISRGSLPNADEPGATTSDGKIFFTWTDNSGMGKAAPTDTAVLLMYCKENSTAKYTWEGVTRSEGAAQIDVANYTGKTVQTWLAFLSADGKEAATSIYTGELFIT
ncbi:MAG: hypothetical protein INR73_26665 [Williamsia sp.]|nr:hypothetical protein [Williamsia sp.]